MFISGWLLTQILCNPTSVNEGGGEREEDEGRV